MMGLDEWVLVLTLMLPADDNNVVGRITIPQVDIASCEAALDTMTAVNDHDVRLVVAGTCTRRMLTVVED